MIKKRLVKLLVLACASWVSLSAGLVELVKVIPTVHLDIRYATANNFTGKRVYPSSRCFLQEDAANALAEVQQELAQQGLGLKVFDGYRPLAVQRIFWGICPDQRYVANPAKGSKHNRGSAIDLTLIDLKTGNELVMPSGYDDFSDKAYRNYNAMTDEAKKNCKLLEDSMIRHGFIALPTEWWHFDYKTWNESPILDISFEEIDAERHVQTKVIVMQDYQNKQIETIPVPAA